MSRTSLAWTKHGDTEYVDHGPFRATIATSKAGDEGSMTIRVRIVRRGDTGGEDTPVYLEVSADEISQQLELLKANVEKQLRDRADQLPGGDEEPTDRVLTASTGPQSVGFYITKPGRHRP